MRSAGRSAAADGRPPALLAAGLRKSYASARARVLDGLDLRVEPGELVHVAGANGAGKTTLLRLLAGLLDPDAGDIAVDGIDPGRDRRAYQRRIAYVSAGNAGLYGRLTVEQHLRTWARMAFVPPAERHRRIAGTLAAFDLGALRARRVDRLSMGQRQRLRLGLALLPDTRLVLLDEPATSLDAGGRARLGAALTARRLRGAGVVWCSPDVDGAPEPVRALVLRGGRLEAA